VRLSTAELLPVCMGAEESGCARAGRAGGLPGEAHDRVGDGRVRGAPRAPDARAGHRPRVAHAPRVRRPAPPRADLPRPPAPLPGRPPPRRHPQSGANQGACRRTGASQGAGPTERGATRARDGSDVAQRAAVLGRPIAKHAAAAVRRADCIARRLARLATPTRVHWCVARPARAIRSLCRRRCRHPDRVRFRVTVRI